MKYGIKIIAQEDLFVKDIVNNYIKTERGYEKWISTDKMLGSWPCLPALSFDDINKAYAFKASERYDCLPAYYYVVEELPNEVRH